MPYFIKIGSLNN